MLAARPKRSVILAAIFSAAAFCWLIVTRHSIEVASDVGFVRCVYGFGLGFLTFQLFRRRPSQSNTALELGIVGAIAAFVSLASGRWTFAAPPLFAASIYFLAGGKGLVSKLLKRPAFQFLGLVSYSIYMIHYFVEERFIDILRLLAPGLTSKHADGFVLNVDRWLVDLVTLGVLALIVAGSYVSYRLIEQPGREITRKWLGPPTSAKRAALD
jgi:peptidoglycan/LPS O-acetylase OafA/YrhL